MDTLRYRTVPGSASRSTRAASRACVSMREAGSGDTAAGDDVRVGGQAEPGTARRRGQPVADGKRLAEQARPPRDHLEGHTVGRRADQVRVDFRIDVRSDADATQ